MAAHYLKLNPSKIELLRVPGDALQDLVISWENSWITPNDLNLGIGILLTWLSPADFSFYNIRRIWQFHLVIWRLDYCISLLAGLPWARSFLQLNQNSATWLALTLPKISHMTKLLCYLHWLPAASLRFIYNTKHGPPPSWRHLSNPVLHLFPPSKPQVQLDWPEYQCLALTWWYT